MTRLRLLGPFDLERDDGETVPIPTSCSGVIAYVVCNRHAPIDRTTVAHLLWPDRPARRARRCLATALWRIRSIEGLEDFLDTGVQSRLQINPDSDTKVDVVDFEQALGALMTVAGVISPDVVDRALAAVSLYSRDAFDHIDGDWALIERERLRLLMVEGLSQLARNFEENGDIQQTIQIAERLVSMEPLREDIHRLLMRAYVACGARAKAIAQYRICQGELAEALAVEPMLKTQSLYQQLVARRDRQRAPSDSARALEIANAVSRKLRKGRKTVNYLGADLDEAISLLDRLTR